MTAWLQFVCTSLLALMAAVHSSAQAQGVWPDRRVMSSNFPFLTQLSMDPRVRAEILDSEVFRRSFSNRLKRIEQARAGCKPLPNCLTDPFFFSETEIREVSLEFRRLYAEGRLGQLVQNTLRESGAYNRYSTLTGEDLIEKAWMDSANNLNRILRVYALAEMPLYPAIDSTSLDPKTDRTKGLLLELISQRVLTAGELFFSPTFRFAELLLYIDERENAGFYPALDLSENAPARAFASKIGWDHYKYSVILVLGDGPGETAGRLGQFGKLRLLQAAKLFSEGLAPLIIVSGGNVHPARTTLNEAVEMKRELMGRHGIPEDRIIIEPFARHTTTNFRNAVRLMSRYGVPLERKGLVTSSKFHLDYCVSEVFNTRLINELGYLPVRWAERTGLTELEFIPDRLSLHVDASDPLDP